MALNNIQQIHNEIEWYHKEDFLWTYISHNERAERTVFLGEKDNLNYATVIKSIKVYINKYKSLLKEAYLLACLKKNRYFTEIVDLFTSDNCTNMYIIMRDHGVDLKDFIKYIGFDYNERYPNISRYIIFNTLCGLKILHDKELSHNDIKLKNIVISSKLKTKICDLGSTCINKTLKGRGTNGYLSPQAILGNERSKEDDMYAVGIVFLELLNPRKIGLFKYNEKDDNEKDDKKKVDKKKKKIIEILKKCYDTKYLEGDWNQNSNYNAIANSIEKKNYGDFEYKLKSDLFRPNEDKENKDLINKLLEINPKKRMKVDEVIKEKMFTNLNFRFEEENNNMKYRQEDYDKYLTSTPNNFKKNIEEIREKFIGDTLLRIKTE
jgi:serine/threonine protein kinase